MFFSKRNSKEKIIQQIRKNNPIAVSNMDDENIKEFVFDATRIEPFTNMYDYFSDYFDVPMDRLVDVAFDQEIVNFYKSYIQKLCFYHKEYFYFLTLDEVMLEIKERSPGRHIISFGFIPFAITTGGYAICFDLENGFKDKPRIVIIDPSYIYKDKIEYYKLGNIVSKELTYENIVDYSTIIADSLWDFLRLLSKNEFDDIEKLTYS